MNRVTFTEAQKKALKLLKSDARHVMLYGGSRSGKTFVTVEYIIRQCIKNPGLRAFIARSALSHAKASLWMETISDVLLSYRKMYPQVDLFKKNESDLYVKFVNGSELFIAGLDNKERVEKILGREFAIIYLNECSEIEYKTVSVVKTRLAQNIKGFRNKMLFDENPPSPIHWSYKMFVQGLQPDTDQPLEHPDQYVSMLMNPTDNLDNLPEDYIDTLKSLPERERRRFLYGEFVAIEGAIFDKFDIEKCMVDVANIPTFEMFAIGMDNNSAARMSAVLVGFCGDKVYALDELHRARTTHEEFNRELYYKWAQYNPLSYPDPAAGALNDYVWNAQKTLNEIEPGINTIREKIEFNKLFFVVKDGKIKAQTLAKQMTSYHLDDQGRIVKKDDDAVDAFRYAVHTYFKYGGSILLK
jgi:phage terminase large subunit